jgi:hypothetical protein
MNRTDNWQECQLVPRARPTQGSTVTENTQAYMPRVVLKLTIPLLEGGDINVSDHGATVTGRTGVKMSFSSVALL